MTRCLAPPGPQTALEHHNIVGGHGDHGSRSGRQAIRCTKELSITNTSKTSSSNHSALCNVRGPTGPHGTASRPRSEAKVHREILRKVSDHTGPQLGSSSNVSGGDAHAVERLPPRPWQSSPTVTHGFPKKIRNLLSTINWSMKLFPSRADISRGCESEDSRCDRSDGPARKGG